MQNPAPDAGWLVRVRYRTRAGVRLAFQARYWTRTPESAGRLAQRDLWAKSRRAVRVLGVSVRPYPTS